MRLFRIYPFDPSRMLTWTESHFPKSPFLRRYPV